MSGVPEPDAMRFAVVTLLLVALAGAPAAARPPQAAQTTSRGLVEAETPAPPPRVVEEDSGFEWSDAAIGAAAGVGFLLLTVGGDALRSHRRERRRVSP